MSKKERELLNEFEGKNKEFHAICIGVLIIVSIFAVVSFFYYENSVYHNVTEHIVDKQMKPESMSDGYDYWIFTNNYSFEVPLKVYNSLNINDTIVCQMNQDNVSVTAIIDNVTYYPEY